MKLILDVENSFTDREYKSRDDVISYVRDISPYNPNNKLISVGLTLEPFKEKKYFCFFHNKEEPDKNGHVNVQKYLDQCTLLIGHNIKHDLTWLRACGFVYEGDVWDTNITEYVLLRGQKQSLKLKDLAERRNLTRKKSDLVQEYFDKGVSLENVDWEIVEEYGLGDIQTTLELYLDQCARLDTEDNRGLYNTIHMMNEFCKTIVYMEGNGIKIDLEELQRVKQEFLAEFIDVQDRLYKLAHAVMGDTPVDLNSPDFKSELIYSRKVLDKKEWKEVFNIGTDYRGKPLKPPRMSPHQFGKAVKALTRPIRKTKAHQCPECEGKGWYRRIKKDGEPFKKTSCCPKCEGTGLVYEELPEIAGFRVIPKDANYTAQAGFVTDAETIDELLRTASQGQAREFLEGLSRYNALRTYLSTFVEGIEKHVQGNGILHTNLNQTITATGRLSSTKPNFQNLPRGKTFPVKRAIISRFEGGRILECDYCTSPYTRILTSDLKWLEAKDIEIGQELIGFDENFENLRKLKLKGSVVTHKKFLRKECVRITTQYGTVVCSTDHMWVARKDKRNAKWHASSNLNVGDTISFYAKPWIVQDTYDAGWLAGFLDGEGSVTGTRVQFGQKRTEHNKLALDKGINLLQNFDFNLTVREYDRGMTYVEALGNQEGLRVLGMFRPVRLLAKTRSMWEGRRTYSKTSTPAVIINVENIGEQDVVAIQTSTGTFIAEGMLSHNCTLEYRIAGYLSGCPAVRHAIETNEDAHAFTRDTINAFDKNLPQIDRQDAKPHTFKPLYGGMSGTPREVSYYQAFLEKHAGVAAWHERLKAEAIATKRVCLPSGREYAFPYAKRLTNGYVNQTTSIVNYPVQGFATADVVPLGIIATHRLFVLHKLRSLLILTVHDSLEVDNHPDEFAIAEQLVKEGMLSIPAMMREFYNMEFDYPIDVELKAGPNWFSIKDI